MALSDCTLCDNRPCRCGWTNDKYVDFMIDIISHLSLEDKDEIIYRLVNISNDNYETY